MSARSGGRSGAARLTPIQSVAVQPVPQPAPPAPVPAPVVPPPARPAGVPTPSRGATSVKGRNTNWTLIAVAPAASRGVRRFELRRWHVRAAVAGIVALVVAAFFGGMALVRQQHDEQLASAYGLLTESDLSTAALSDTLRALRLVATLPGANPAAAAAAAAPAVPAAPVGRVVLPVDGRITSRFARARRHPILGLWRRHDGMDIAAPSGTPIHAPSSGRVVRIERQLGYGLVLEINHGRGVHTFYAHLRSTRVTVGQRVAAGTVVATVGSTGLSTGPHLHYEVREQGRRVDPLKHPFADAQ